MTPETNEYAVTILWIATLLLPYLLFIAKSSIDPALIFDIELSRIQQWRQR